DIGIQHKDEGKYHTSGDGGEDRFARTRHGRTIMAAKDEIAQSKRHMEKAIEDLRTKLATIRTGRASISILDRVMVEYYGTPTPLNQVAQLAVPEPTQITVQPYDVSLVGPIEKAIRVSDLNLNPSND